MILIISHIIASILVCNLPEIRVSQAHEFYLSMIDVSHRDTTDMAKFTVKVFTDDLENALYNMDKTVISFNKTTVDSSNLNALSRYFDAHLKIAINGSTVHLKCADWEIKGESTFIYFHSICPTHWSDLELMADYFMELFPTQMHVVQVYNLTERRFIRLTARHKRQAVVF